MGLRFLVHPLFTMEHEEEHAERIQCRDKNTEQHAQVREPYSGVVLQRLLEEGAYAKTGDPMLRMMADTDMEIEADVPFDRLRGLAPGLKVHVTLDDGKSYPAVVRAVIPDEDRRTRTRAVRFSSDFADAGALADGQNATVQIPIGEARTVTSVHKDAVNRRGDKTLVFVVENEIASPPIPPFALPGD